MRDQKVKKSPGEGRKDTHHRIFLIRRGDVPNVKKEMLVAWH
jgi:hypothetical protein